MNAKTANELSKHYNPQAKNNRLIRESIAQTEINIQESASQGFYYTNFPTCKDSEKEVREHFHKLGYHFDNNNFIRWD